MLSSTLLLGCNGHPRSDENWTFMGIKSDFHSICWKMESCGNFRKCCTQFCLRWSILNIVLLMTLCDLATPKSCYRHNLASIDATLDQNSILLKYQFFWSNGPTVGVDELESGQAKFDGHETSFGKRNIFWIFRVGSKNQFNIIHVTSLKGQSVDRCQVGARHS